MPPLPQPIAVYALTEPGARLARKIADGLPDADIFLPPRLAGIEPGARTFVRIADALADRFATHRGHVLVAAAGIVVRAVAPLLLGKTRDPAIVVVDPEGRFAVSLLSGHLGGANDLARTVAGIIGGQAVITTATDAAGKPAIEEVARELGLKIENLDALPRISRDVLEGAPVEVYDPGGWLQPGLEPWAGAFLFSGEPFPADRTGPAVWVGPERADFPAAWLVVRPPCLALGLGCNRGTSADEIEQLIEDTLKSYSLSPSSIGSLASIEAKRNEPGLLDLARRLDLEILFYPAEELRVVETPNPSAAVERHMGVSGVCEAAAMLAARTDRLMAPKRKSRNATLAVALIGST